MADQVIPEAGTLPRVQHEIDRILIHRDRIAERLDELAEEVCRDLDARDDDAEIMLVPILTGAIILVADLMRRLPQKLRINVVTASSYIGKSTATTGDPTLSALSEDLTGKHVLIVDDILDSGTTIRRVREETEKRNPRSVHAFVLLRKDRPSAMGTPCEYIGFDIPDEFVVGYGLDYNGFYRNLPDIGVPKKEWL